MISELKLNSASELFSWRQWRDSTYLQDRFNLSWPISKAVWAVIQGDGACPICDSTMTLRDKKTQRDFLCVCQLINLEEYHTQYWTKLESNYEKRGLTELIPFDYGDNYMGGHDLVYYKNKLEEWVQQLNMWFFVEGGTGSGKTHTLHAMKTFHPELCVYISMDKFEMDVRKYLAGGVLDKYLRAVSTVPILLLDDWGLEHTTDWLSDQIEKVINTRFLNGPLDYLTVVTTNMSIQNLATSERLNLRRTASRLSDPSYSKVIRLRQADYRRPDVRRFLENE